jgi:hypothetical protein
LRSDFTVMDLSRTVRRDMFAIAATGARGVDRFLSILQPSSDACLALVSVMLNSTLQQVQNILDFRLKLEVQRVPL